MHSILARHLQRRGLGSASLPSDLESWRSLLDAQSQSLVDADNDRYLLERSLAVSSEEMSQLHRHLADERDLIDNVICSLGEGVCALDAGHKVIFLNPEAARILDVTQDVALGSQLADLQDARAVDGRSICGVLDDALAESDSSRASHRLGTDDNFYITAHIEPLHQGRCWYVLTLQDITAQEAVARDRDALNRQLLETSRLVGMSEVADCVLHNVGNVLNSINVSVSVLIDRIRSSDIGVIKDLAGLIPDQPEQLREFFLTDTRGQHISPLLGTLGAKLADDQSAVLAELQSLAGHVEHIREVVSNQQAHARVGVVAEDIDISLVVSEALKINEDSLRRHCVTLDLEESQLPLLQLDRHKVLQILVNLISNAKYACDQKPVDDRRVYIRTKVIDDVDSLPQAVIEIGDNGCGMPRDVLGRIFEHGFSTRDKGHGFGLHYCSLAAKELGGELRAHSDGVGRGAAFTLVFPVTQPQNERAPHGTSRAHM